MAIESKKWLKFRIVMHFHGFSRVIYCFDIPCFSVAGFIRSKTKNISTKTTYHCASVTAGKRRNL